jgi:hypothetical protein
VEANAGLYLEKWEGKPKADIEHLACLVAFMEWMYTKEENRKEQVGEVMTAVNTTTTLKGHVYLELFNHPLITRAERACLKNVPEQRSYSYNDGMEGRKKLGICKEMVWMMREKAWLRSDNGMDGLIRKAAWISSGLCYDLGSRPGNVTQPDGPKAQDHNTRTGDLVFTVRDGSSSWGTKKVKGGEDLRVYLSTRRNAGDDVLLVDIGPPTDKAIRLRKTQTSLEPRPIMRRSKLESLFLTDLCDLIVLSFRMSTQPLAGR